MMMETKYISADIGENDASPRCDMALKAANIQLIAEAPIVVAQ